jgi:hypothetical protein
MKGRASVSLLLALLTLAVVAAPAGAAQDLPSDLWNPLPPDPSAPAQSSGGVSPLLVLAVCALVAVAGFLIGERLPIPARGKPKAKAPRVPRRHAARFWRFEGCTIALSRSGTTGEFEVVVGRGVQKQVIGRSPPFEVPRSGHIPDDGPARAAHDVLLAQLQANGWQPVGSENGAWHRVKLVRQEPIDDRMPLPA